MKIKSLVALSALALPGFAAAQEPAKTPDWAASYTGTLEFSFGFGGTATAEPEEGDKVEADLSPTLSITPGLDKMLGKTVGLGLEFGFNWFKAADQTINGVTVEDDTRQLVLTPMARLRMAFPVYAGVTADAMFALGAGVWMADDDAAKDSAFDSTRVGWALRFNFGGSYQFNPTVAAFASVGYMTTTSYGDDLTATLTGVPFNIGLRGGF